MRGWLSLLLAGAALAPCTAHADVVAKSEQGFVVRSAAETAATPQEAWKQLVHPAQWWDDEHTFSGKAANLSLDPVAGGCFCEVLPAAKDAPKGTPAGGVQHMRVVYVQPGYALRMVGALGPLQSEAVTGTLTITLKPMASGTRILWEYVVGGYMRYPQDQIAPAVDKVIVAQLASLVAKLGPAKTFDLPPGDKDGKKSDDSAAQPSDKNVDDAHRGANDALDAALSPHPN